MSISTVVWIALGVVVVVLLAAYVSQIAGRLDRLHLKVESTRSALDAHVAYRSALALELAQLGVLPADESTALANAAKAARDEEVDQSGWHQESVLTGALIRAFASPDAVGAARAADPKATDDLAAVCRRVQYARRFHNDSVRSTRQLRERWIPRTFRLAGHAAMPAYVDFDDSVPEPFETS